MRAINSSRLPCLPSSPLSSLLIIKTTGVVHHFAPSDALRRAPMCDVLRSTPTALCSVSLLYSADAPLRRPHSGARRKASSITSLWTTHLFTPTSFIPSYYKVCINNLWLHLGILCHPHTLRLQVPILRYHTS